MHSLVIFTLINITLHYLFSYIGLAHMTSSRSVIIDTMGSFFMILFSCLLFADDSFTKRKLLGCLLGFGGLIVMNWQPEHSLWAVLPFFMYTKSREHYAHGLYLYAFSLS